MSHSGVSRYDFGPIFGIDHGDKQKGRRLPTTVFPDLAAAPSHAFECPGVAAAFVLPLRLASWFLCCRSLQHVV